jgi:Predicted dehydrogenases and related proteins
MENKNMKKLGIGLYGTNGHQIGHILENHADVELKAVAAFEQARLPVNYKNSSLKIYSTLDEMLKDENVDLVSLCSPRRREQADEAVCCLEAGKYVYAEKPCAMDEKDLDRILETSARTGMIFHEMAGTAFENPYISMKKIIEDGVLGEIVQVFVQKSYPLHNGRPQDEDMDGGLICQVGVHALRYIEHVAGVRIKDILAVETSLGNPVPGGNLHIAASYMAVLENGGIASIICNYLNPSGFGSWGNEHVRIFGTKGMMESVDAGARTRLILGDKDMGPVKVNMQAYEYFDLIINEIYGRSPAPLNPEVELHPTRMVIRAKQNQWKSEI